MIQRDWVMNINVMKKILLYTFGFLTIALAQAYPSTALAEPCGTGSTDPQCECTSPRVPMQSTVTGIYTCQLPGIAETNNCTGSQSINSCSCGAGYTKACDALGNNCTCNGNPSNSQSPFEAGEGAGLKENPGITFKLTSPINVTTFEGLLSSLLNIFLVIATPIIVLFIIYAGFLYVTARGNAEQTKQATKALTYAIIGGVILLGSVAIAEIVKNVVEAFRA